MANIHRSPYGDIDIPEIAYHTWMFDKFIKNGDNTAMIDGITGEKLSYRELLVTSKRLCCGLVTLGVNKGDVLCMYSPNSTQYVSMFWATLACGATITTINPDYTLYEMRGQLDSSGCKYIYTTKELLSKCKDAIKGKDIKVICEGITDNQDSNTVSYKSLLVSDSDFSVLWQRIQGIEFEPKEDVAVILYSSGTTGLPKGVMITHFNCVANREQTIHVINLTQSFQQQVVMCVMPFYHTYGLIAIMGGTLALGGQLVILPKFEPHSFFRTIELYKVTLLQLAPPVVIFLAKTNMLNDYDLSSVTRITCGAAPLSKEVQTEIRHRLRLPDIKQNYGLTEATAGVTRSHPNTEVIAGSSGMLLPNTEAKIVDVESREAVGVNVRGEILVRGPQVMKGYLNNPEQTSNSFDKDHFYITGDIGYVDDNHNFFIVDRIKELIKVKGFQVAPAELEAVLLTHPGVSDAGVVGVPDERSGEIPRAFIVKKSGVHVSKSQLQQFISDQLSAYKHLKGGVKFVDEIPRLPSGKIIRRKLREMTVNSKL